MGLYQYAMYAAQERHSLLHVGGGKFKGWYRYFIGNYRRVLKNIIEQLQHEEHN